MKELIKIGLSHTKNDTPLRDDAFELSDDEKIKKIEYHFARIMQTLGLDLYDDSLSGTPHRIAKMYVEEIFSGLNPENKPDVSLFIIFSMRAPFCADHRKSACRLYSRQAGNRVV